jgi:uncharacterized protein
MEKDTTVNEERVAIPSAGLRLAGVVRIPQGAAPCERRAAFLVLHGFGSNKNSQNVLRPANVLDALGYVTLRFDMRGCGESEGQPGRVICLEQVEDTQNALTCLARHRAVDPDRIGVIGTSFGGAVAVYAGVACRPCDASSRMAGSLAIQLPAPVSQSGRDT